MEPREDLVVRHRSMADEVTERTRRLILSRELQPGERIRQAELATMMGVSTMPVREALLRLVSEGMVLADANRSFTVAMTATPFGIRDIYWIHAELAGELAARAWDTRDEQLLAAIEHQHQIYTTALAAGSDGRETELFHANWAFHSAIHHHADAPAIALAVKNTLRYFPDFSHGIPGWYQAGADWQADLMREFADGTREGARHAVAIGSARSAELYIRALWPGEERSPGTAPHAPTGLVTDASSCTALGLPAASSRSRASADDKPTISGVTT